MGTPSVGPSTGIITDSRGSHEKHSQGRRPHRRCTDRSGCHWVHARWEHRRELWSPSAVGVGVGVCTHSYGDLAYDIGNPDTSEEHLICAIHDVDIAEDDRSLVQHLGPADRHVGKPHATVGIRDAHQLEIFSVTILVTRACRRSDSDTRTRR